MHRPGIAKVSGDRVLLDGTTIDEVEKYHRETLLVVLDRVNQLMSEHEERKRQKAEAEQQRRQQHEAGVSDVAQRIKFD